MLTASDTQLAFSLAAPLRCDSKPRGQELPERDQRIVDLVLVACELSDSPDEIADLVDTALAADLDPSLAPALPTPEIAQ